MDRTAQVVREAWTSAWKLPPEITVSQWADQYRELSSMASSQPGRWRTSRTPYLREIMDSLSSSDPTQRVIFQKGSQIGGSEAGNNWIGCVIHHDPGPMLMVLPTVDVARRISKQRLAPMLASTPVLAERVAEPRARDSGNTVFMKDFPGGTLILTGANSAPGLISMPVRNVFFDEVDRFPEEIEGEGDPVAMAVERTATFPQRKVYMVSTPTVRGLSRIEKAFLASDQRRYFLPCPICGHMDYLTWTGRDWLGSSRGGHHRIGWLERDHTTAHMVCSSCEAQVGELHKTTMLANGEWRPTTPGDGRTRGYHLSALYSPFGWKSWAQCVDQFLTAKDDPVQLRVFVNQTLGETWEQRGTSVEPHALMARLESYPAEVPAGVGILVASVDVQDDRLEVLVTGYGAGEESWPIAHEQLHGDPGHESLWFELDRFLKQPFHHESGRSLRIECTVIDSGGHHTEQVYRFCKARLARRVFAVRGGNLQGQEVVGRPTMHNRYRVKLFTLCVDTAKDVIYSRLQIASPGPGYIHLPDGVFDLELLEQLTAEVAVRKYVRGRGSVRQWIKKRDRNEMLDLTVYCLAALYILGPVLIRSLPERAKRFAARVDGGQAPGAAPELQQTMAEAARPLRRLPRAGSSWVQGWRFP